MTQPLRGIPIPTDKGLLDDQHFRPEVFDEPGDTIGTLDTILVQPREVF